MFKARKENKEMKNRKQKTKGEGRFTTKHCILMVIDEWLIRSEIVKMGNR